ncbi:MAG: Uma2 family endonuclease [Gammaproteobacteria bacterium]|nr:Uma2 family endonuclease [Gammaproteobacteria bacterium]
MAAVIDDIARRHRINVPDYHRMAEAGILRENDRVELIEGEIIDMTPTGIRHAGTVARLEHLLNHAIDERAIVWAQNPIVLGEQSEPEPDIALVRSRQDFYTSSHPTAADVLLVIEVADTSLRYDREVKMPLYARHGVPEAWLVDLDAGILRMSDTPARDGYAAESSAKNLEEVPIAGLPGITLDLSSLFQGM